MRSALLFLLGLLLGACTTAPAALAPTQALSLSHATQAAQLARRTVALVQQTEDGPHVYCAGVWVSPTTILTAEHCVAESAAGDALEYLVLPDATESHTASLYARDEEHDLALLRAVSPLPHVWATTASQAPAIGDWCQTMGHSLGLVWTYSTGEIAGVRRLNIDEIDSVWIQANLPISPGNSGGGLFDERGDLIGLTHGSIPRGQLLNVFVHQKYIDALLKAQSPL